MPYPGEILAGTYQILKEIGKGGAGIIYLAYHVNLRKYVVVKKMKENVADVLNIRGEADILKSLHHTYLPQVYDFLQVGTEIYTVMEYIEGHDLQYYLERGYRPDEQTLIRWMTQLSEVLVYLHKHRILHLDIKPANIMLTSEGNLCLIDFNVSLGSEESDLSGISMNYASPEQYQKWQEMCFGTEGKGTVLDGRTDIYSLGASLYSLMTGYLPSVTRDEMAPITAFELPYSTDLIGIVDKMLVVNRQQRYQSAAKILKELHKMQRTKEEKRSLQFVFGGMLTAVVILGMVLGVVIYRNYSYVSKEDIQAVSEMEHRLHELCMMGEYDLAYLEGIVFCNTQERTINKLEGAKQSLLEKIAETCLLKEDYFLALTYIEQLILMEEKAEYYKNKAVATAYQGRFDIAEQALKRAEELGMAKEEILMCSAEMLTAQGRYEEALQVYQEIKTENPLLIRKIASLALKAAEKNTEWITTAVGYYEWLKKMEMASYADKMNLVTAYSMAGWEKKAFSQLKEMNILYPNKYEVCLKLGILSYNAELKKAVAHRDFTQAKEYIKKADNLYKYSGVREKDAQLESMIEILREY